MHDAAYHELGGVARRPRWWYRHYPSWDLPVVTDQAPDPGRGDVLWRWGRFRVHRSIWMILVPIVPAVGFAMYVGVVSGDPNVYAFGLSLVWLVIVAPAHHEAAHVLVARRFGFRVNACGVQGRGAYVYFAVPAGRFTPRQGVLLALAGPAETLTAAVVLAATAWWLGPSTSALAVFFVSVAIVEGGLGLFNLIPLWGSDGATARRRLRFARTPLSSPDPPTNGG